MSTNCPRAPRPTTATSTPAPWSRLEEFDRGGHSHSLCGNDTEWLEGLSLVNRNGEIRYQRSMHPNEVGHQVTAEDVPGIVDGALGAAPDTDEDTGDPTPSASSPGPITGGVQRFGIGDEFSAVCVVAWPTAPTYTTSSIELTMSCHEVPQQFMFVHVSYPDPSLPINPLTGSVPVHGRVGDIAVKSYGFKTLMVAADQVDLEG